MDASIFNRPLFTATILALTWIACAPGSGHSATPNPGALGLDQYRQFALQHDGDAARGRALFSDLQKLGCARCHAVAGDGGKVGPDLSTVGDQFPRRDLIEAVLQPSATIAVGYSTTVVETKSGEEIQGVLKQSTEAWIELACADGQSNRIRRVDIERQRGSSLSLMPEGLQAGLSLQEFADLIEFLTTLKESPHSAASHHGMPEFIPELKPPARLRPILSEPLRIAVPRPGKAPPIQTGLVWFEPMPDRRDVFLAGDQCGVIWRVENKSDGCQTNLFADFTAEVFSARGPNGLLGIAFHPKFRDNRKYYLKHQVYEAGQIATVVVEKRVSSDGRTDSGEPSRTLLTIGSGAEHHNGGWIRFGPDGLLYLGMGDSAPNDDPQGHGQDLRLLWGKILRLDIDHPRGGLAYTIPRDNPFRGPGVRPEIWAWGFREPWRFSFDRVTGDLWVGDLGQERGDEVDIVRCGENHGWNVYQGFELFSPAYRSNAIAYVPPIFAAHRYQGSTLIGGCVYRGDRHSSFYGVYIFGDYTSKRIWGLTQENRSLKMIRQLASSPQSITSFSMDEQNNIFVTGYQGMVYQLDLSGANFQ